MGWLISDTRFAITYIFLRMLCLVGLRNQYIMGLIVLNLEIVYPLKTDGVLQKIRQLKVILIPYIILNEVLLTER